MSSSMNNTLCRNTSTTMVNFKAPTMPTIVTPLALLAVMSLLA